MVHDVWWWLTNGLLMVNRGSLLINRDDYGGSFMMVEDDSWWTKLINPWFFILNTDGRWACWDWYPLDDWHEKSLPFIAVFHFSHTFRGVFSSRKPRSVRGIEETCGSQGRFFNGPRPAGKSTVTWGRWEGCGRLWSYDMLITKLWHLWHVDDKVVTCWL